MTEARVTDAVLSETPPLSRRWGILAGRLLLALALLLAWELAARALGPVFFLRRSMSRCGSYSSPGADGSPPTS